MRARQSAPVFLVKVRAHLTHTTQTQAARCYRRLRWPDAHMHGDRHRRTNGIHRAARSYRPWRRSSARAPAAPLIFQWSAAGRCLVGVDRPAQRSNYWMVCWLVHLFFLLKKLACASSNRCLRPYPLSWNSKQHCERNSGEGFGFLLLEGKY